MKETKAKGAADNKSVNEDAEKEDIIATKGKGDEEDAGHVPDGFGKQSTVASSGDEAYRQQVWSEWRNEHFEKVKNSLPDGPHLDTDTNTIAFAKYIGWQRSMVESGNGAHVAAGGMFEPVSGVRPARYAASYDDNTSDAAGLYLKLVDSMGMFHDERRSKYKLSAAA